MPTALITGSTDGIGLRTAQVLADRAVEVLVHGRDPDKVARAQELIGPRAVAGFVADFGRLDDVAALAEQVVSHRPDILINNAGIYARDRETTPDGHESTWAVNHLAASLLTDRMLPEMPAGSRVVYVSSIAHSRGRINLDDPEFARRPYDHYAAYAQSKLANLLMARETARRLGPEPRALVNALHPGVVGTKLLTEGFRVEGRDDLDAGCATAVYLALDAPPVTGGYFADCRQVDPAPAGRDDRTAALLYDWTLATLEP